MSTELATALRGKKSLALLALLAVFAVFAVLGTRGNDAQAAVDGADWTITGPCFDVANDPGDDCDGTEDIIPLTTIGESVIYEVAFEIGVTTASAVQVVVDFDETELDFVGLNEDNGDTSWTCSETPAGSVTCTSAAGAPLVVDSTGTFELEFTAAVAGIATFPPATVRDTGDPGQPAQPVTANAEASEDLLIVDFNDMIEKDDDTDATVAADGETYWYDVVVTYGPDGMPPITLANPGELITITDDLSDLPASSLILDVDLDLTGITTLPGDEDVDCSPDDGDVPTAVTDVSCTVESTGGDIVISAGDTITLWVQVAVPSNPDYDTDGNGPLTGDRVIPNTASATLEEIEFCDDEGFFGGPCTGVDSHDVTQFAAAAPTLTKSAISVGEDSAVWRITFTPSTTGDLLTDVVIADAFDNDYFAAITDISITDDTTPAAVCDGEGTLALECTLTGVAAGDTFIVNVTTSFDEDVFAAGEFDVIENTATADGEQCAIPLDPEDFAGVASDQVQSSAQAGDDCAEIDLDSDATLILSDPVIRHLDIDAGTEDAVYNLDGILPFEHDFDDAVASYHAACLIEPLLIFDADDQLIGTSLTDLGSLLRIVSALFRDSWEIDNTAGSPTISDKAAGIKFLDLNGDGGDEVYACVEWRSAGIGDQTVRLNVLDIDLDTLITLLLGRGGILLGGDNQIVDDLDEADFIAFDADELLDGINGAGILDFLVNPLDTVYYDGLRSQGASQPLIKEWNLVDTTKIVGIDGLVGGALPLDPADPDLDPPTILDNTDEAANWLDAPTGECVRDAQSSGSAAIIGTSCFTRANLDGETISLTGALDPNGFIIGNSLGATFIDYTVGHHDGFTGPVDGAVQRYTVSGECGSIRLEDPATGEIHVVSDGESVSGIVTSDYGTAFTILPTEDGEQSFNDNQSGTQDCRPGDSTTVTIETDYASQLISFPNEIPDEQITINWFGSQTAKQPLLAWAGQRIVLEHDWTFFTGGPQNLGTADEPAWTCDGINVYIENVGDVDHDTVGDPFGADGYFALYELENGVGAFVHDPFFDYAIDQFPSAGDDTAVVSLQPWPFVWNPAFGGVPDSCVAQAIYEQEVQGQVDIKSTLFYFDEWEELSPVESFNELFGPGVGVAEIGIYNFLVYYMEFEDVTTTLVPGGRTEHNAGAFASASGAPWDPTDAANDGANADVEELTSNVSADVLVRVRVRGWVQVSATGLDTEGSNRPALQTEDGRSLPSARYVLPDDWRLLAGGATAETFRPNYDIMTTPGGGLGCNSATICVSRPVPGVPAGVVNQGGVTGPFSLLDGPLPNDSIAAYSSVPQLYRQTWLADGVINQYDAPMPPALVSVTLTDETGSLTEELFVGSSAGFLKTSAISKFQAYGGGASPFYQTEIPANPILDTQNYLWESYGDDHVFDADDDDDDGPYPFFTSVLTNRLPNNALPSQYADGFFSESLVDPTKDLDDELVDIAAVYGGLGSQTETVGRIVSVYSDNHGEALVWANGDFNLTYDECPENLIGGGYHCDVDQLVGQSHITAVADYPDFKKKPAVASNVVAIDWTWGGYKEVTIVPGVTPAFKYVVFHAVDRDGFCSVPFVQATATVRTLTGGSEILPVYVQSNPILEPDIRSATIDVVLGDVTIEQPLLVSTNAGSVAYEPDGDVYTTPAQPHIPTVVPNDYPWYVPLGTVLLHSVYTPIDDAIDIDGDPLETVDFFIDAGEGLIIDTSGGKDAIDNLLGRSATGLETYSTERDPEIARFDPAREGVDDECQAWIQVSNSLLGILNVLVTAHDDEGDIAFDTIVDFNAEFTYDLHFRWTLITWFGADNIPVEDALAGTGLNEGGDDISESVTVIYGWEPSTQEFLGYFPGTDVPEANDLDTLTNGDAYWIAIDVPEGLEWKIITDVGAS